MSMKQMATISCVALGMLAMVAGTAAFGAERDAVHGRWAGDRSVLEISEQGGELRAVVIALDEPNYLEGEDFGPVGAPRRDDLNPDESLRDRRMIGVNLLSDYTFDGNRWQGRIYDPESGKTYASNMQVGRDGNLKMRGYIGVPMFGRTAVFEPIARCAETALAMLRTAGLDAPGCSAE